MADELKRVGLVFTADGVVDFKKSISTVNAAISENLSAYKLAQAQWDQNTSSSQKLADKQKFLANQTSLYTDKVTALSAELGEMESSENRNEEAIFKKKAALQQAQSQLEKYRSNLDEVNRQLDSGAAILKEYAGKLEDISEKTGKLGDSLETNLTNPIMDLGKKSMDAWSEVDAGLDTVIQKTGASGDSLAQMQEMVKAIATEIPTDFQTAGDAVGEVNTRFGLTGDALQELSKQFIQFADINGQDVNAAIDQTQKAMAAFNVDTKDAGLVLDTLNAVGQETGVSLGTLESSLTTNAAALQQMGFDISSAAKFLGTLDQSGVDSSAVMTGLKKALANAAKEGKSMPEALAEVQESMTKAKSSAEGMQSAIDLFGSKAGPAIYQACSSGELSFASFTSSLSDHAGSLTDTFERTLDPSDRLEQVMNNLKLLGYEIGEAIQPLITEMVDQLIPIIQKVTEVWEGLDPAQREFIVKAALVAAACGPVLKGISSISGGISSMLDIGAKVAPQLTSLQGTSGSVLGFIKSSASGLFTFLAANPVLAIIAGIVAALVILYNKCDWFRNGVNKVFGNVRDFIQGVVEKITGFWSKIDFKLPKIKLPHFSLNGGFSFWPPSVPSISVSWYKNGGILNSPTIFGAAGNYLLGAGEAGPEAVVPLDRLRDYIKEVSQEKNQELVNAMGSVMVSSIERALREIGPGVYLNQEKIGEIFSDKIQEVLFHE